ncbi:MAG: SRPBCC domain-containing protein [Ignavibacteriae bacterium]|nr:SRPBCC domain-containing protein [Ignavibacteriota bacterium]
MQLIKEITLNAPVSEVWSAITGKEEMKEWYFDLEEFIAEEGFRFEFTAGEKDKLFLHLCEVIEVIPGKKLVYSWRYDGEPGISYVSWELFPEGDSTKLVLTHSGLETFPDKPEFDRKNFEAGWTSILEKSLKGYLEAKLEQ